MVDGIELDAGCREGQPMLNDVVVGETLVHVRGVVYKSTIEAVDNENLSGGKERRDHLGPNQVLDETLAASVEGGDLEEVRGTCDKTRDVVATEGCPKDNSPIIKVVSIGGLINLEPGGHRVRVEGIRGLGPAELNNVSAHVDCPQS